MSRAGRDPDVYTSSGIKKTLSKSSVKWYLAWGDTRHAHGWLGIIYLLWLLGTGILALLEFVDIYRAVPQIPMALTYTEMSFVFIGLLFLAALSFLSDKDTKRFRRAARNGDLATEDAIELVRSKHNILGDFNLFIRAAPLLFVEVFLVTVVIFGTSYLGGTTENAFMDGHYLTTANQNGVIADTPSGVRPDTRLWYYHHAIFLVIVLKAFIGVGEFFNRTPVVMVRSTIMKLRSIQDREGRDANVPAEQGALYGKDAKAIELETLIS